jgi:hypothetical protein
MGVAQEIRCKRSAVWAVGLLLLCSPSLGAAAARVAVDPITQRMIALCEGKTSCVLAQRAGVREFLAKVVASKRPSQQVVQRCLRRSTTKQRLTNWKKAARCL